jgi:hypothetical protein
MFSAKRERRHARRFLGKREDAVPGLPRQTQALRQKTFGDASQIGSSGVEDADRRIPSASARNKSGQHCQNRPPIEELFFVDAYTT